MAVHVAVTSFYFCLLLAAYTSLAEESLTSSVHATSLLKDRVHSSPDHSSTSTSNSKNVETNLLSPRNRRDLDPNQIRQFYNNNKVSNRALQSAFRYNDEILRNLLQSQASYNRNPYNSARSEFFYNILRPLDRRTTRYNSWDDHSVMHFVKRSIPSDDPRTIQLNGIESIPSDGQAHVEDSEEKLNLEKRSIPSDESRSIHSNSEESVLPDNSKSMSTDSEIKQKNVVENGGVVKRSSSWSDHGVLHFGKREYDENKLENKDDIPNHQNSSPSVEDSRKEEDRLPDQLDLSDIDKRDNNPWHSIMSFGKRNSNDPWHSVMSFGKRDGNDPWHNVMSFGKRDSNDPWHSVMSFGKRDGNEPWHNVMSFGKRDSNDPWHSVMSFGKRDGNDPWHSVMSFGKRDSNDPWHSVMSFGKRDGNDPWHNVMSFGKRDSNDPWHNVMSFGKRDSNDPWHSVMSFGKRGENDPWHNVMSFGKRDGNDPWHNVLSFGKRAEKVSKDISNNNKENMDFLEKGLKQKRSIRETSEPYENELVPEKRFDVFKDHNTMHFGKKSDPWDSHNTLHFGKKSYPWDSHNTLHFGKKSHEWNSHNTMHFGKKSDPWESHTMHFGKKSDPWESHTMHFGKKSDPWESHTMHFGKKSDPWDSHNTMHFGKRSDVVHDSLTKVQKRKVLKDTTEQPVNSNTAVLDNLKLNKRSAAETKDGDSIKGKNPNNQEKIEKYEIRVKRSVILKNVDAIPKNTELKNTMLDNQNDVAGKKENQTSIESSKNKKGTKPEPKSIEGKSIASNIGRRSVVATENKVSNYITSPQINEEKSIKEPNSDRDKVLHFGKRSITLDEFENSMASDNQWNNEEEQLTKRSENYWDLHNTMHFGKKSDPWDSHNTMHFGKKSDPWDSHNTMHFGKKSDPWESHTMHFGKKSDPWDSHNTMHFGKKSDPWDSHNTMHFGKKSDPWESHTMHFGKKSDSWDSHNTMHFGKKSDPWDSHNTMHFGKKSDPWDSHNTMHFGKKSDPWDSHNTMHFGKRSDPWESHNTMHFGKRSEPWDSHNTLHFGKRSDPWDSHNTMHFGKRSDPWDSHNTMHFGKRSDSWDSHNTLHFGKKSELSGNQSSLNSDFSVGIANDEGASSFLTVPEMMYLTDLKNSQDIRLKWNEYLSQLLAKLREGTINDSEVQSLKHYLTSLLEKGYISPEEPAFRNEQLLLEFLEQFTGETSNKIPQAEYEDEDAADEEEDPGTKAVNKRYWAPFQGPKSIVYPHAWFASQIRRSVPGMEGPPRMFETRVAEKKKEDPVNSFMHFGKR